MWIPERNGGQNQDIGQSGSSGQHASHGSRSLPENGEFAGWRPPARADQICLWQILTWFSAGRAVGVENCSCYRKFVPFTQNGPPVARGTLPFIVKHHMSCGLPAAHIEIPPPAPITTADLGLVERLVNAHEHAILDEAGVINKPGGDVWEMVGNEFHGEFVAALRLRQIETLATILNAAFRHDICYGLGGGVMVYQTLQNAEGRAELAALTIDRLASLAEALALLPYENPEQGRWGENIYIPPVELADRIEAAIGIPVCPPDICGYFGIRIRDGFMFSQSCNQLYLATRMRQILTGNSWPRRACEIGAGYGGTAYYATLLGLTDYRIFDLPVINVLQGYYLTKALPQHRIVLYGEPTHASALWVYPYWMLKSAAAKSFGIVVNQDSFPEIAPAIVADYLTEIVRTSNCLLSINQESQGAACNPDVFQNLVPRMADQNPGLRRVSRFPFWLRRGYVEEVYYTAERNEPALKRMTKNCIRRLTGR